MLIHKIGLQIKQYNKIESNICNIRVSIILQFCLWILYFIVFYFMFQISSSSTFYPCTHVGCSAVLKTVWSYQQHMRRHAGIYQYNCPYCNKGLNSTTHVKEHLKSQHTGLLGFHCIRCRQEFKHLQLLKTHLMESHCRGQNLLILNKLQCVIGVKKNFCTGNIYNKCFFHHSIVALVFSPYFLLFQQLMLKPIILKLHV